MRVRRFSKEIIKLVDLGFCQKYSYTLPNKGVKMINNNKYYAKKSFISLTVMLAVLITGFDNFSHL